MSIEYNEIQNQKEHRTCDALFLAPPTGIEPITNP